MADLLPILLWGGLATLVVGISKSGFGSGFAMLAPPILMMAMPPAQAVGILLPVLIVIDAITVWYYWGKWDWSLGNSIVTPAIFGIALGWLLFSLVNDDVLKLFVGVLAVGFPIWQILVVPRLNLTVQKPSKISGRILSATAGFTSTMVHAGAPPLTIHLLRLKLKRDDFVAVSVYFFAAVNFIKLVPYGALGLLAFDNLTVSLMLLPFVPLGAWLGIVLKNSVPERPFFWIIYAALFFAGVKLIYDVFFS